MATLLNPTKEKIVLKNVLEKYKYFYLYSIYCVQFYKLVSKKSHRKYKSTVLYCNAQKHA